MTRLKIGVADTIFPDLDRVEAAFVGTGATFRRAASPSAEDILEVTRDADGVFVTFAPLTADIIDGLEACKVIGRFGIGVDNIDVEAATRRGIVVTNVPDYCSDEVSDHVMALLLTLARKTAYADGTVRDGRWEMPAMVPIHRLKGRVLGLVGLGKIPPVLVPKAKAFGLHVLACSPTLTTEAAAAVGVEAVSFNDLIERSDFVSIHCPLTSRTRHLMDAEVFRRMKREAFLINTGRGPIVDEGALAAALDAGEIAGAGLDVLTSEPPETCNPLIGRDNVVITPHIAFYSDESLADLQSLCARDVARVLQGLDPYYPVNPEVLKSG